MLEIQIFLQTADMVSAVVEPLDDQEGPRPPQIFSKK